MRRTTTVPDSRILRAVDQLATACSRLGVLMVIFVAGALSYEAIARYFFHAPTQWTQDVSVTLQLWFTYLAMAWVLKDGEMIRITALLGVAPRWFRSACEVLALLVMLGFSVLAVYMGWNVLMDSIHFGRRQPTMLALPNWISELPIVIGFALLAVQCVAELIRLPFRGPPSFDLESTLDASDAAAPAPPSEQQP